MAVTVAETGSSASFVDVEPRSPASEVGLSDVPHIESPALAWTEVPVTMPGRVRLEVAFHATASKDPTLPESNEDAWAFDEAGDGVVMLDGATESFAARRWARLLAGQWATGGADWLATAQSLYARARDGACGVGRAQWGASLRLVGSWGEGQGRPRPGIRCRGFYERRTTLAISVP